MFNRQIIFIQLFKNGLAYKDKIAINWCPSCKIGLANEEVVALVFPVWFFSTNILFVKEEEELQPN